MKIIWSVLMMAYLVQGQYDSPLPPRAIIQGSEPIGPPPGRSRIRGRVQPQIVPNQDVAPPPRIRRPPSGRVRPLPAQDPSSARVRPHIAQEAPVLRARPIPFQDTIPRAKPLPLEQSPIPKSKTYPEEASLPSPTPSIDSFFSPKPVTEEIEEDIQVIPASPSTPALPVFSPTISPSPTPILESKVFRTTSRLDDPLLKQPQRALFKPDFDDEFQPAFRPAPVQKLRPLPPPPQSVFEAPIQRPTRPIQRTRPAVQPSPPPQQLTVRPRDSQPVPRPISSGKGEREKKPVAQVIRKYREENEDGSITWGFENDDGTWKEETIGVDCVVSGKYGYVDPDGVRREYTYSSGIPCNKEQTQASESVGYMDYETNQYVLPNGQSIDLGKQIKNKARRPVQPRY